MRLKYSVFLIFIGVIFIGWFSNRFVKDIYIKKFPYVVSVKTSKPFSILYYDKNVDGVLVCNKDTIVWPKETYGVAPYIKKSVYDFPADSLYIVGRGEGYIRIYGVFQNEFSIYLRNHSLFFLFFIILVWFYKKEIKKIGKKDIKRIMAILLVLIINYFYVFYLRRYPFFNDILYVINLCLFAGIFYYWIKYEEEAQVFSQKVQKIDLLLIAVPMISVLASVYMYFISPMFLTLMDTYHVGESLTLYEGLKNGFAPYKDVFLIHGFLADPGLVKTAFYLFGESISSFYLWKIILTLLTFVFLFLWLYRILDRVSLYIGIFTIFILGFFNFPLLFLDRYLPLFIILFFLSFRSIYKRYYLYPFFVLFATLYSLDVGIIIFVVCGSIFILEKLNKKDIYLVVLGIIMSGIIFLITIKFNLSAFVSFLIFLKKYYIKISFYPYNFPTINTFKVIYVFPLMIQSIAFAILYNQIRREGVNNNKYGIILGLISFIIFWVTVNRADTYNLVSHTIIIYVFFLYSLRKISVKKYILFLVIFVYGLYYYPYMNIINILSDAKKGFNIINYIENNKDIKYYIPHNYYMVYQYLSKLPQHEKIYVLSSEGIWYYLFDSPHITKYMYPVFASDVSVQKEIIEALDKNKPQYIIYNESIDKFTNIEGKPFSISRYLIWDYVQKHYKKQASAGDVVVLVRVR